MCVVDTYLDRSVVDSSNVYTHTHTHTHTHTLIKQWPKAQKNND